MEKSGHCRTPGDTVYTATAFALKRSCFVSIRYLGQGERILSDGKTAYAMVDSWIR